MVMRLFYAVCVNFWFQPYLLLLPLPLPLPSLPLFSPLTSKDVEVGGAELRGEVEERSMLLEVNEDPQQTLNTPQPDLKVTAAER